MAFAQTNYPVPMGIPPTKYTIAQIGCFLTSFCNLQERFGRSIDPPSLNNVFKNAGFYVDVDDGVRDDLAWSTISRFDPRTQVSAVGGASRPPHNNSIVKFQYNSSGAFNTHFCLVQDVNAGTIIDSWDGKIKSWNVYGGVKAWASYNNIGEPVMPIPTVQRSDVKDMFNVFLGIEPTEGDYGWAQGKTWEQYTKAVMERPEARIHEADVRAIWAKFLPVEPSNEDIGYAVDFRKNFRPYIYDVMSRADCVSVELVKQMKQQLVDKDKVIADLQANQGEDSENLNKLGEILGWLIKRIGLGK